MPSGKDARQKAAEAGAKSRLARARVQPVVAAATDTS